MKFEPLNGHILVAQCEDPRDRTHGTLVLPEGNMGDLQWGIVVARDETTPVHICDVGNIVYFKNSQASNKVLVDGGEMMCIVREQLLLGVDRTSEPKRVQNIVTKEQVEAVRAKNAPQPLTGPKLLIAQ